MNKKMFVAYGNYRNSKKEKCILSFAFSEKEALENVNKVSPEFFIKKIVLEIESINEDDLKEYLVDGYWDGDKNNASFFLILATSSNMAKNLIEKFNPNFTVEKARINPY